AARGPSAGLRVDLGPWMVYTISWIEQGSRRALVVPIRTAVASGARRGGGEQKVRELPDCDGGFHRYHSCGNYGILLRAWYLPRTAIGQRDAPKSAAHCVATGQPAGQAEP